MAEQYISRLEKSRRLASRNRGKSLGATVPIQYGEELRQTIEAQASILKRLGVNCWHNIQEISSYLWDISKSNDYLSVYLKTR